jgi:hypothetical protein
MTGEGNQEIHCSANKIEEATDMDVKTVVPSNLILRQVRRVVGGITGCKHAISTMDSSDQSKMVAANHNIYDG